MTPESQAASVPSANRRLPGSAGWNPGDLCPTHPDHYEPCSKCAGADCCSPARRFRKKPVEVEAVQWNGTAQAATPIINWLLANDTAARYSPSLDREPGRLAIDTLEGTMRADSGDWIIRGVKGEFYPCKPDIFEATYEAVEPCSCGGSGWVDDEGWEPTYLGPGRQTVRNFGNGFIPCGFCNPEGRDPVVAT